MYHLKQQELNLVAGGCGECHDLTLQLLEACSLQQMGIINAVFKSVILSDELKGQSPDVIKAAIIHAVENSSF